MSHHEPQNDNDHALHATQRANAPKPGSPLQPGADGNPQAIPVAQPAPDMPDRQPVKPSSDISPKPKPAPEHAASTTSGTGNEDPGAEIEDLPINR